MRHFVLFIFAALPFVSLVYCIIALLNRENSPFEKTPWGATFATRRDLKKARILRRSING
jgi:hypothetical protein